MENGLASNRNGNDSLGLVWLGLNWLSLVGSGRVMPGLVWSCLYTLLESLGHELNRGWSLVLAIIQHCAGSDTSTVAAAAFRSVQLIVTDFLSF